MEIGQKVENERESLTYFTGFCWMKWSTDAWARFLFNEMTYRYAEDFKENEPLFQYFGLEFISSLLAHIKSDEIPWFL